MRSFKLPSTGGVESPCGGCELRAEGCHAICMKYFNYKEALAVKRKARRDELVNSEGTWQNIKHELNRRTKRLMDARARGVKNGGAADSR